jgi:hypothetical protein
MAISLAEIAILHSRVRAKNRILGFVWPTFGSKTNPAACAIQAMKTAHKQRMGTPLQPIIYENAARIVKWS